MTTATIPAPIPRRSAAGAALAAFAALLARDLTVLRKQPADARHELERLEVAGQVITQLTAGDVWAAVRKAGLHAASDLMRYLS